MLKKVFEVKMSKIGLSMESLMVDFFHPFGGFMKMFVLGDRLGTLF